MVRELELEEAYVQEKTQRLRAAVSRLPVNDRGSSLRTLLDYMLRATEKSIRATGRRLNRGATPRADQFYFVSLTLELVHRDLTHYRDAVGRDDLPVGLLHLVDQIMREVGLENADPIIWLNPDDMYSTRMLTDSLHLVPSFEAGDSYSGRDPVVINLPAVDPQNALLSPILIHEAGHSAVKRRDGLLRALKSKSNADVFNEVLTRELTNLNADVEAVSDTWTVSCDRWWAEYLCDALAIAIAGPSFLFAFIGYAPPRADEADSDHPYEWDRIAFALHMLDRTGWTPWLEANVPAVLEWCHELEKNRPVDGQGQARFKREVSLLERDQMIDVVLASTAPMTSSAVPTVGLAAEYLSENAPAAGQPDLDAGPWEIVLAGWVVSLHAAAEKRRTKAKRTKKAFSEGIVIGDVPIAARKSYLNRLVIKSIEAEALVRLWKDEVNG